MAAPLWWQQEKGRNPLSKSGDGKKSPNKSQRSPLKTNGYPSNSALVWLGTKLCFSIKGDSRTRAALLSGNDVIGKSTLIGDQEVGIEIQLDAIIAFGTLATKAIPTINGFPIDNDEFDLDRPTEGFSSIPEAIEDIRQGKMVVVVDDEDRENEGDLIMAASLVTPEAMAFIVKHGTGIVCVSMKGEDLERMQLPLMVTQKDCEEKISTAFTKSVIGFAFMLSAFISKSFSSTTVGFSIFIVGFLTQLVTVFGFPYNNNFFVIEDAATSTPEDVGISWRRRAECAPNNQDI